jgi:hypothetical protein
MLRNGYAAYYDVFGIRPEDVGQGRGEILGEAALGLLVLVGRAAADQTIHWIVGGGGAFALLFFFLLVVGGPGVSWRFRLTFSAIALTFGIAIVTVAIPRSWKALQSQARNAGLAAVGHGNLVNPIRLDNLGLSGSTIVLDLRAEAVSSATPLAAGGLPPALQAPRRRCLLYLGSGDGVMVMYDVRMSRLVRVPTASAVLEFTRPKPHALPSDCAAGPGRAPPTGPARP